MIHRYGRIFCYFFFGCYLFSAILMVLLTSGFMMVSVGGDSFSHALLLGVFYAVRVGFFALIGGVLPALAFAVCVCLFLKWRGALSLKWVIFALLIGCFFFNPVLYWTLYKSLPNLDLANMHFDSAFFLGAVWSVAFFCFPVVCLLWIKRPRGWLGALSEQELDASNA